MLRGLKYYCLCVRRTFQHGPGNTLCIHIHRGATLYKMPHDMPHRKNNNTAKMHNVQRAAFIYFANVYVVLMKIASESKSEKSFLHTQIDSIL